MSAVFVGIFEAYNMARAAYATPSPQERVKLACEKNNLQYEDLIVKVSALAANTYIPDPFSGESPVNSFVLASDAKWEALADAIEFPKSNPKILARYDLTPYRAFGGEIKVMTIDESSLTEPTPADIVEFVKQTKAMSDQELAAHGQNVAARGIALENTFPNAKSALSLLFNEMKVTKALLDMRNDGPTVNVFQLHDIATNKAHSSITSSLTGNHIS